MENFVLQFLIRILLIKIFENALNGTVENSFLKNSYHVDRRKKLFRVILNHEKE